MRPRANVVLIVLFSAFLLMPALANWLGIEPLQKLDEKRALAARPIGLSELLKSDLNTASLKAVAEGWDKYFTDHFGLRKLLVGSYRFITVHVLDTSLHPAVIIGKIYRGSRWYFYNGSAVGDGSGLESLQGKNPYSSEELALTAANVQQTSELLRRNGVKFILMVVPDPQTVYPFLLPSRMQPPQGAHSRLDQFWSVIKPNVELGLIDLRAAFEPAKDSLQLYMATDPHWTEHGTYIAYRTLIETLQKQDHGPPPLALNDMQWQKSDADPEPGGCAQLMGLPMFGGEVGPKIIFPPRTTYGRPRAKKLLVLNDSFFAWLKNYLEFEFDEVVSLRAGRSAKVLHITQTLIDTHKPDVVLLESVERYWAQ